MWCLNLCFWCLFQVCREHGLCRSRYLFIPIRLEVGPTTAQSKQRGLSSISFGGEGMGERRKLPSVEWSKSPVARGFWAILLAPNLAIYSQKRLKSW